MIGTWWIDDARLLGSSNPSEEDLRRLREQGFRTLVCLLDDAQKPRCAPERAASIGYERHAIALPDMGTPTVGQLHQFVDVLESDRAAKVVVHCEGGCGRTGTFGAAYLVSKGFTPESAIVEIRKRNPDAIETPDQENAVHEFAAHLLGRRAEDTLRRLVALLYREVGVLEKHNHARLAKARMLRSGFFDGSNRKTMARDIFQSNKRSNLDQTIDSFASVTGLSLDDVRDCFRDGNWTNSSGGYSFGGPKWAEIAETTLLLRCAFQAGDLAGVRRLLSKIDRLGHNNGPIVDKFPQLGPS